VGGPTPNAQDSAILDNARDTVTPLILRILERDARTPPAEVATMVGATVPSSRAWGAQKPIASRSRWRLSGSLTSSQERLSR
jgi:hypothetical protein